LRLIFKKQLRFYLRRQLRAATILTAYIKDVCLILPVKNALSAFMAKIKKLQAFWRLSLRRAARHRRALEAMFGLALKAVVFKEMRVHTRNLLRDVLVHRYGTAPRDVPTAKVRGGGVGFLFFFFLAPYLLFTPPPCADGR
jgi:hypothetical protein